MKMEAQRQRGELRLEVRDPSGVAVAAAVDLTSEIQQLHRIASADAHGQYSAQDLPFGLFRVTVSHLGFQPSIQIVRIGSEVPVHLAVTLGVAPIQTSLEVTDAAMLV